MQTTSGYSLSPLHPPAKLLGARPTAYLRMLSRGFLLRGCQYVINIMRRYTPFRGGANMAAPMVTLQPVGGHVEVM
ncbi:hypothetical protein H920_18058 [Fukomys damarensis]|uniref:Uncharacterized protein n=1 Tax=Fukomys damarensis TaxID=885580 RepID=A0A091CRV2_FUKDA|nr:hypothetical protein H920_18058 [Fukomys damarensis]